jgi:asparagine synthase (glutamine-hydrolysing)
MCGIVGMASIAPVDQRAWLAAGRDAMRHRGPDDAGEWWSADGRVGLGHRRLSIIDLSSGGHQPMVDRAGDLTITFNGEIYNFTDLRRDLEGIGADFTSYSDTEVLLAAYRAWGEACLSRLNGMFAFAIHDARRGTLFLARDRAGEKPLYYHLASGTLSFGSELKALMQNPRIERRIDAAGLDCFLGMGYAPGNHSILAQVRKLPPAHAMRFDLASGKLELRRYWSPPAAPETRAPADEDALCAELETLLGKAVRRQLVADVPVGILLSGGLDSSIVTALAATARSQVKTFTVRFPGAGKLDESEHARRVAEHFGTDHSTLVGEPSTVELLPLLARQFDEPMNDSSMVPTFLVSQLIRKHCTVALGGDGGDELFGGYTHYDRMLKLQERFGAVPLALRRLAATAGSALLPTGFKGRNWVQALAADFRREVPLVASYFDRGVRSALLGHAFGGIGATEKAWAASTPAGTDLLDRATRLDFGSYLPEDILVKVDRTSMLNSLEIRAPMLDIDVVEFAFGRVPSRLKASSGARKILLQRLARKLLPASFDTTRKQGFSIPISSWLESGPWLQFFRQVLLDPGQEIFNRARVEKLFQGQTAGHSNGERLFGLVMFELWRREYAASL